jgi:hypothetical protein
MATYSHRNDIISKTRQASTALLKAHADLEAAKAAWDRGISTQIIDATGADPNAVGYQAGDFRGHEGLVKADITRALGVALDALRTLLMSNDGKKFEDIAQ